MISGNTSYGVYINGASATGNVVAGNYIGVLADGATFEKAGVNRSLVEGVLEPALAQRIGARFSVMEPLTFFVTGLSLVVPPRSPMVPTVHLNVRYFEIVRSTGEVVDAWFGGGTDLTKIKEALSAARAYALGKCPV